jgi:hypothetical protein
MPNMYRRLEFRSVAVVDMTLATMMHAPTGYYWQDF